MNGKILMVDVDGVIVHPVHPGGWAAQIEGDLGITKVALETGFLGPTGRPSYTVGPICMRCWRRFSLTSHHT
ncbi:MAG: hypothetical protein CGW95_13730 [Phenylobacterium zucineum]|nr:MAG: hypothetical protein CGW95_13730 [Phenylobacterium zucineum]